MKYLRLLIGIVLFGLLAPMATTSCVKENQFLTEDATLTFSMDTVKFDTVFVSMGTTTRQVKVYNENSQPVRISSITLEQGAASRFRLNVDGDTSMVVRNLEIAAHDSIFIFVQACINPNSSLEPFIVEDHILFNFEKGTQKLLLTAFGRNAVYHIPDHLLQAADTQVPYSIIDCDNWDHSRPHVIVGYAVVDSRNTLTLTSGDQLYFDNDAVLWIYDSASLKVQGTYERPVLFTSVRHDGWYDQLPGQWGDIWISPGAVNNEIDWAVIENGYIGLIVDGHYNNHPTLRLSNTRIQAHSEAGIYARNSNLEVDNVLISDCGVFSFLAQYGGKYQFSNSTLSNYYSYSSRNFFGVYFENSMPQGQWRNPTHNGAFEAAFKNCLIYGPYEGRHHEGELSYWNDEGLPFDILFDHCLLKSTTVENWATISQCVFNKDPLFYSVAERNYHLCPESPALGMGSSQNLIRMTDLENNPRLDPPSVGCFDFMDTSRFSVASRYLTGNYAGLNKRIAAPDSKPHNPYYRRHQRTEYSLTKLHR